MFFLFFYFSEMTPSASSTVCPICLNVYGVLSLHLRRFHKVNNSNERKLLLNLATGRVNIRTQPCPVMGCTYNGCRLDSHMTSGHPELSITQLNIKQKELKKRVTVNMLAQLRASQPTEPIISVLDIAISQDEQGDDFVEEEEEAVCKKKRCSKNQKRIKRLQKSLKKKDLEARIWQKNNMKLARKLRHLQAVSVADWKVNSIVIIVKIITIIILSLLFSSSGQGG